MNIQEQYKEKLKHLQSLNNDSVEADNIRNEMDILWETIQKEKQHMKNTES